jgi:hypothetical protein
MIKPLRSKPKVVGPKGEKSSDDSSQNKTLNIAVCGFQNLDLSVPLEKIASKNGFSFKFFPVEDTENAVDNFDGAIFPSGCFESIVRKRDIMDTYLTAHYRKESLLERQLQVVNLLQKRGWVCFLTDAVTDKIEGQGYHQYDISKFDLTKLFLNQNGIKRRTRESGYTPLQSRQNEFHAYTESFGVAYTVFEYENPDVKQLITNEHGAPVGINISNKIYFLPFQQRGKSSNQIANAVGLVSKAVVEYRAKNEITLPAWLNEIRFGEETELSLTIESLSKQITELIKRSEQLAKWKAVLTTSGDTLVDLVDEILTEFFGINTEREEKYIEDLKVLRDGVLFAALEIKGQNGGVKGANVSQVATHRERLGKNKSLPGILIINDNAKLDGVDARKAVEVHKDHVELARFQNITILKTVDLLTWMVSIESLALGERRSIFEEAMLRGGGWLIFEEGKMSLSR